MVLIVGIASVCGYQYLYWYEHKITDQMALSAVDSCTAVFEVFTRNNDGTPQYDPDKYAEQRRTLRDLCKQNGMEYMYAYKCDPETNTVTYIMCVAADDALDERVAQDFSFGTTLSTELSDKELEALKGNVVKDALVRNDEYGARLSWFREVRGWNGVLAGVDYSIIEQRIRVLQIAISVIIPLIAVLVTLFLVQLRMLNKHVFGPIQTISSRMKEFTPASARTFEPLEVGSTDEIGEIAGAFEDMAADIDAYMNDIERMTTERVQVDVELDVARRMQQGIVPERTELSGIGFDAYATSRPARSVGGDFYDIFELDNGHVAAIVGDASGKGIAAALFMSIAKTMIRDGLLTGRGPADVLNAVNEQLCASNPEGMFITVLVCVLDPQTGMTRMANAGHMPPLVIGRNVREITIEPGILLGLFDDADIEEETLELQAGECLMLLSDGVTEAINAEESFFTVDGLLQCLEDALPFSTAKSVIDAVAKSVRAFVNGREQFDDMTVLALRLRESGRTELPVDMGEPGHVDSVAADMGEPGLAAPPIDMSESGRTELPVGPGRAEPPVEPEHVEPPVGSGRTELPVDMSSFSILRDAIMSKATDRTFGMRACLACEEAFTNIVSYSGAQSIWIAVDSNEGDEGDEGELRVVIEDDGVPFDPFAARVQEKPFEELDEGGMGIGIIREMTREASYHRTDERNVLELVF